MGPNPQETADLVIFTEEILKKNFNFCILIKFLNKKFYSKFLDCIFQPLRLWSFLVSRVFYFLLSFSLLIGCKIKLFIVLARLWLTSFLDRYVKCRRVAIFNYPYFTMILLTRENVGQCKLMFSQIFCNCLLKRGQIIDNVSEVIFFFLSQTIIMIY